jgi:hypothetical protein
MMRKKSKIIKNHSSVANFAVFNFQENLATENIKVNVLKMIKITLKNDYY